MTPDRRRDRAVALRCWWQKNANVVTLFLIGAALGWALGALTS